MEKERKEEEKKKEEGRRKKRIQVWNLCSEFWFGSSKFMFRTFLFVSMEPMYGFVG